MFRVLEQETKQKVKKTFAEINPFWSKLVHETPQTDQVIFERDDKEARITDPRSCIVGEFYDGDSYKKVVNKKGTYVRGSRHCKKCEELSDKYSIMFQQKSSTRKEWIDEWVNHVNEKHL